MKDKIKIVKQEILLPSYCIDDSEEYSNKWDLDRCKDIYDSDKAQIKESKIGEWAACLYMRQKFSDFPDPGKYIPGRKSKHWTDFKRGSYCYHVKTSLWGKNSKSVRYDEKYSYGCIFQKETSNRDPDPLIYNLESDKDIIIGVDAGVKPYTVLFLAMWRDISEFLTSARKKPTEKYEIQFGQFMEI